MMKRRFLILALGSVLACSCSTLTQLSPEEILTGTWKPEGSVAIYEISFVDGEVGVSGRSEYSGKHLRIIDASWDGEVLRFTSYMASTDMKVVHENRITSPSTMVSSIVESKTGEPRSHTVVWHKKK